jgi:myosin V
VFEIYFSSFIVISIIIITSDTFQDLVNSLERKIGETEKKYEETSRISEERMSQIIDTESRMIELKTNMQRFL